MHIFKWKSDQFQKECLKLRLRFIVISIPFIVVEILLLEFGISCEAVMINSLVEPGRLTNIYKSFRKLKKRYAMLGRMKKVQSFTVKKKLKI